MSEEPSVAADLGQSIALGLSSSLRLSQVVVAYADERAAAIANRGGSRGGTSILELREACRKSKLSGQLLVLVSPKLADVSM